MDNIMLNIFSLSVLWKVDMMMADLQLHNNKFEIYFHSNYTVKCVYGPHCV
jgi:hypothetical protein